jgi:hypothetical protein
LELYARRGRFRATVEPKIVELDQNRVDLVFEIFEGDPALISRVTFVGNNAFSEARLRDIVSSQEQTWFRVFSSSDIYDPERLAYDRELLRRFYLRQGFADVQITGSSGELTPDRSAFFVTFTIDEGKRYRIGKVEIINEIPRLSMEGLRREIEIADGDWYDGDAVERGSTAVADALQARGDAFSACLGQGCQGVQQGRTRDRLGSEGLSRIASAQNHAVVLNLGFNPALNLAVGNAVQHGGIGGRWFCPEIAVAGGQIAEILRNGLHRVERVVKPLQSAREGAIGNG